jgi:hypothetical protein
MQPSNLPRAQFELAIASSLPIYAKLPKRLYSKPLEKSLELKTEDKYAPWKKLHVQLAPIG